MKKIILIIFALLNFTYTFCQQNIDSLTRKIDSLERRLDESHYTRVPNQDFDTVLNTKVKDAVYDWFLNNALLSGGILAALIALLFSIGRKLVLKDLNDKL